MLTVAQAASELAVSRQTVWRWMREGKLQAFKVGARYRASKESVEACIEPITQAASPERCAETKGKTHVRRNQEKRAAEAIEEFEALRRIGRS